MGWLDRFLRGRRQLLDTAEPERAFAPDPFADTWQLASGGDNEQAIALIRRNGLSLVAAASGEVRPLSAFAGGVLLFATAWEPYSAKTIGSMRGRVEAGEVKPFGVVLFENTRDEVTANKAEAWYFPHAYVLAPASVALRPLVGRVPFQLFVGASGSVERVVEGKAPHP
jgi:hypothetical protein